MKRIRSDAEGYLRGSKGFANEETRFRKTSSTVWEPTPANDARGWGENLKSGHGIDGDDGCRDGYSTILRNKKPDDSWEDQGAGGRSLGGTDLWNLVEENGNSDTGNRALRPRQND
jgi:hypothetical protein